MCQPVPILGSLQMKGQVLNTQPPEKLADGLSAAKEELRETYRIKMNCDYSYTHKYNKVHVLCQEVYEDSICKVFAKHGVEIATIQTYT